MLNKKTALIIFIYFFTAQQTANAITIDLAHELQALKESTDSLAQSADSIKNSSYKLIACSALAVGSIILIGGGVWVLTQALTSNDEKNEKNFNRNATAGTALIAGGAIGISIILYQSEQ